MTEQQIQEEAVESKAEAYTSSVPKDDGQELENMLNEEKKQPYVSRKQRLQHKEKAKSSVKNFQIRGQNINPIIDASSSLLGLIVRLSSLKKMDNINDLRRKIAAEIKAIETELYSKKYDRATILAHRYALCSVLDEAVMTTDWGADSDWSANSLLSQFHNETWGGEKFFTILQRLMAEPNRYFDLLEFMYVTLTVGFEGMYRVRYHGRDELNQVIEEVLLIIRKQKGDGEGVYTDPSQHIYSKRHKVNAYVPPWVIFSVFGFIMFGIWAGFTVAINNQALNYEQNIKTKLDEAPIIRGTIGQGT